jgi:hypothetical protein
MSEPARILALALAINVVCCLPAMAQPVPPALPGKLPSFKIEAVKFKCLDETGYDWLGSDEIRIGIESSFARIISREFGDVDTDETRSFKPEESCILPVGEKDGDILGALVAPSVRWSCSASGAPGPFSFEVTMVEVDVDLFGFSQPPPVAGGANDLIGRRTVAFTAEELAAAMPAVGDTAEETITLGPCVDPLVCGDRFFFEPEPAEYTFTWRLTRMPDALPPLDPDP